MIQMRLRSRLLAATVLISSMVVGPGLSSSPTPAGALPVMNGYWMLTGDGGVFNFGVDFFGAPASDPTRCPTTPLSGRVPQPNGTCWTMASTRDTNGYWIMNSLTGAIYGYGDAANFGSPKAKFANTSPEFIPVMKQIVPTPDNKGYWVYEIGLSDIGSVDHYGNAGFFGDTTTLAQQHPGGGYNGRPVGMAATADGKGYWEVYSDGGVFAFGNARFFGSMASRRLAAPIVGITATKTGKGYWLVASDGGVFAFGDAPFAGSRGGMVQAPIIALNRNPAGPGYWLGSNNGQMFTFGGAPFLGTLSSTYGYYGRHVYAIASR